MAPPLWSTAIKSRSLTHINILNSVFDWLELDCIKKQSCESRQCTVLASELLQYKDNSVFKQCYNLLMDLEIDLCHKRQKGETKLLVNYLL